MEIKGTSTPLLHSSTGTPPETTVTQAESIVDFLNFSSPFDGGRSTPRDSRVSFSKEDYSETPPPLLGPQKNTSNSRSEQDAKNQQSAEALMKAIGARDVKDCNASGNTSSTGGHPRPGDSKLLKRHSTSHQHNEGRTYGSRRVSSHGVSPEEDITEVALKAFQRSQFFKTRMCPHFLRNGKCRKANECNYAHDESELQPSVNLTKTKLCQEFIAGKCYNGIADCGFAHGVQELRSTSGFYKTQLCKFWLAGHCPAGALCRHAHGDEEWPSELQARLGGRRKTDSDELISLRRASATPTDSRRNSVVPQIKGRHPRLSVSSPSTTPNLGIDRNRNNSDFFFRRIRRDSGDPIQPRQPCCDFIVKPSADESIAASNDGNISEADNCLEVCIDDEHVMTKESHSVPTHESLNLIRSKISGPQKDSYVSPTAIGSSLTLEPSPQMRTTPSIPVVYSQGFTDSRSFTPTSAARYTATPAFSPLSTTYSPLGAIGNQTSFHSPTSTTTQPPIQMPPIVQSQGAVPTGGFYIISAIPLIGSIPHPRRSLVSLGSQSPRRLESSCNGHQTGLEHDVLIGGTESPAFSTSHSGMQNASITPGAFTNSIVSFPTAICTVSPTHMNGQSGATNTAPDGYIVPQITSTPTGAIAMSRPVTMTNTDQSPAKGWRGSDFYQVVSVDTPTPHQRRASELYHVVNPHAYIPTGPHAAVTVDLSSQTNCYGFQLPNFPAGSVINSNVSPEESGCETPQSTPPGSDISTRPEGMLLRPPSPLGCFLLPCVSVEEFSKPGNFDVRYED